MPADQNKKAVERMLQAFNSGDLKIVDELLDKRHYKDYTPFPGTDERPESLKKQILHLRKAFPDVKFSVEHMVAEGETVAFRWKMTGTQRGSFLGHKASGKKVTHFGNDFVTFQDGKMVEHRSADGLPEMLGALGHEPRSKVKALNAQGVEEAVE